MIAFLLLVPALLYGISVAVMLAHIHKAEWRGGQKGLWQLLSVIPGMYLIYRQAKPWAHEHYSRPQNLKSFLIVNVAATVFSFILLWLIHPPALVVIQLAALFLIWSIYWEQRRRVNR